MVDENKIDQVFAAIIENGLDAFKDDDLVKLLSMLNRCELNEFETLVYNEFYSKYNNISISNMASKRITRVIPIINYNTDSKMDNIRNSNLIEKFNYSLKNNNYESFIHSSSVEELSDLKFYLSNNVNIKDNINVRATKKLIDLIIRELKTRVGKFN